MDYITGGQASIDRIIDPKGNCLGTNLGGPGVFAYTGIRLWEDSVRVLLNVAEDFWDYYGSWLEENKVDRDGLITVYDHTHSSDLVYQEDGSYNAQVNTLEQKLARAAEYGWTNLRPDQIDANTKGAKAFYLFLEPTYFHFWKELKEIRDRNGFAFMWEIGIMKGGDYDREHILRILDYLRPEMASLNHNEAMDFFGIEDIDEIFRRIHAWKIPMFFYRAGSKGSYLLAGGKSWFVPSIDLEGYPYQDATGCGNSSTAAAMFAWQRTQNPVFSCIVANVTAGVNVSYSGIIRNFTEKQRKDARQAAAAAYDAYLAEHPEYAAEGYAESGAKALAELDGQ